MFKVVIYFCNERFYSELLKKTMIEYILNTSKLRTHSENNNNVKNSDNENTVIILNKEKKLIFNDLQYYISKFMLWVQKLTAAFSDDSSLLLSLLLISTQKLVDQFNKWQQYLNNFLYQKKNHLQMCQQLSISNSDIFCINNMHSLIKFMHWQFIVI